MPDFEDCGMKTVSSDQRFIDYWQDYGTARKSHFGVRVWEDRCCAITNVGSANPTVLGKVHPLPVDFSETAPKHSVSNVTEEHMYRHPESDLLQVLTGKKPFREALHVSGDVPKGHHRRP
jgi:hypothetical protein